MPLLGVLLALAVGTDPVIVLPPVETSGPERLLIFIPGGNVPNEHYRATAAAIQEASSGIRLTVVIPGVFNRLCIITCSASSACFPLKGTVDAAVRAANFSGTSPKEDTFLAAHSLGATCANYLMQGYNFPYAGLITMGGYVDEKGPGGLAEYKVPVMTIGAELDGGLARPNKLALWYKQAKALPPTKPVVVLPDIDHSDFCPGFAVPGDLASDVDRATSLARIGEAAAAFLTQQVLPGSHAAAQAGRTLERLEKATAEIMEPVLASLALETAGEPDDTLGLLTPATYSPWCVEAQKKISGLAEGDLSKLEVLDFYYPSGHKFEHSRTHYEKLPDGRLRINISIHCDYDRDFSNTGERYASSEIACKLTGADRVAQQLAVKTDESLTCSDLNELAVATASKMLSARVRERYERRGRKFCFQPDKPITIGPLFVFTGMGLKDTGHCLDVQALSLVSKVDSHIFPGVHYCKVLSPSRAMDWMMTDSLQPEKSAALIV